MFEETLSALLQPLVPTVPVYWDTTPDGFVAGDPCIILQKVGGKAAWYVDKTSPMPSHKHTRVMVTLWSKSRLVTAPLARLIEKTIAESALIAEPIGAPTDISDSAMKLFGSQQHFGFWYPDP